MNDAGVEGRGAATQRAAKSAQNGSDGVNRVADEIISAEAPMLISQWGKSLAIRLPKTVVAKLGVREGDDVDIRQVGENRLVIVAPDGRSATFEVRRPSAKAAQAKATPRISP